MRPGCRTFLIVIAAIVCTTGPSAAQCSQPQGNASLAISGLPQIGGSVRLALSGRPLQPLLIAADRGTGPMVIPGIGTICLGTSFVVLVDGFNNPFFLIPASGTFVIDLTIPNDPGLPGTTWHFQGVIGDRSAPNGLLAISNSLSATIQGPGSVNTIFFDDFEAGPGNWYATNGLWEVGPPSSVGPQRPFSGVKCAGTVLSGNYPQYANTRLISPRISLPSVAAGEQIRLTFWHWYSLASGTGGVVEVSPDPPTPTSWVQLCATGARGSSPAWTVSGADLSTYASTTVRIAFRFTSDYWTAAGWYVDDVRVFKGIPFFRTPETWEMGIGDWWGSDNGLWQVGTLTPGVGPAAPHSGTACAGTILGSGYPQYASTRLISPPITLPSSGSIELYFWEWHSMASGSSGQVQVSTDNGCTWASLPGSFWGASPRWTQAYANLSDYRGRRLRIGFLFSSDYWTDAGWYLDDIRLEFAP